MRQIKFRAWDGQKMTDDFYVNHLGGASWWDSYSGVLLDEDWPLMQFTGRKDKNGKEIYEGDILNHGDKLEVCFGFNNGENEGWYLKRKDGYEYTFHAFTTPHEVIGNIYENPGIL